VAGHHYRKRWGAEPVGDGKWRFALWAPDASGLAVDIDDVAHVMAAKSGGWHEATVSAKEGGSYRFLIGGQAYPDPAARAQVGDVHGASLLVQPDRFDWTPHWAGIPRHEAVIYELHIGTFTEEGTFEAARLALPRLKGLGITLVEIMPVAQFDGRRGWGYDGVLPYTPHNAYGSPDEFKHLVDTAHKLGMGVILDVVHNHLGPSGNYLAAWCPSFFHADRVSPWGQGLAYEEAAVRGFFIESALYWLTEYQLDGLRFDAVHAIEDHSPRHFLDELGETIRAQDWGRPIHLITEDERNLTRYFTPDAPFDATWNDDWHHAIHCLLTGEDESYYAPFAVAPLADIEIALRDGYVEQGQARAGAGEGAGPSRGEDSSSLTRTTFVNFLGNHDQVGNRAQGERLHQLVRDIDRLRVVTALTLLTPFTPMIFMGDEFLTDAPFLFFADFSGDLAQAVRTGRAKEFAQFKAFGGDVPDPIASETARASRIGMAVTDEQHEHEAYVRELLDLRRQILAPLLAGTASPSVEVQRVGPLIDATWHFGPSSLLVRCALGDGEPFERHVDPFFVEERDGCAFALSAAIRAN
jgi:malto-oligosyltrehalose trehalohydrolase